MSRSDTIAGLSEAAVQYIGQWKLYHTCPCCGLTPTERIGTFEGMFGTKYPLHKYRFYNGKFATEYVQASPWSSGPVVFLGLKVSDGTTIEWTEEDMEMWL